MKTVLSGIVLLGMMLGLMFMAVSALDAEAEAYQTKINKHVARMQP